MGFAVDTLLEYAQIQRDATAPSGSIFLRAALECPRLGKRGLVDEPPAAVGDDDALSPLSPGCGSPTTTGAGGRVGPRGRGTLVSVVR